MLSFNILCTCNHTGNVAYECFSNVINTFNLRDVPQVKCTGVQKGELVGYSLC